MSRTMFFPRAVIWGVKSPDLVMSANSFYLFNRCLYSLSNSCYLSTSSICCFFFRGCSYFLFSVKVLRNCCFFSVTFFVNCSWLSKNYFNVLFWPFWLRLILGLNVQSFSCRCSSSVCFCLSLNSLSFCCLSSCPSRSLLGCGRRLLSP